MIGLFKQLLKTDHHTIVAKTISESEIRCAVKSECSGANSSGCIQTIFRLNIFVVGCMCTLLEYYIILCVNEPSNHIFHMFLSFHSLYRFLRIYVSRLFADCQNYILRECAHHMCVCARGLCLPYSYNLELASRTCVSSIYEADTFR